MWCGISAGVMWNGVNSLNFHASLSLLMHWYTHITRSFLCFYYTCIYDLLPCMRTNCRRLPGFGPNHAFGHKISSPAQIPFIRSTMLVWIAKASMRCQTHQNKFTLINRLAWKAKSSQDCCTNACFWAKIGIVFTHSPAVFPLASVWSGLYECGGPSTSVNQSLLHNPDKWAASHFSPHRPHQKPFILKPSRCWLLCWLLCCRATALSCRHWVHW